MAFASCNPWRIGKAGNSIILNSVDIRYDP